jgi:hypothetical protein
MAKCEICEGEMLEVKGCNEKDYLINGKVYQALPHVMRDYTKFGIKIDPTDFRCHDCGAKIGEPHHTGCDMEVCPCCEGQFISCDCEVDERMFIYENGRPE